MGNGGNWEAMGKTLMIGGNQFFTGDFDGAGDTLGNSDMYSEQWWKDMEKQKKEAEKRLKEAEKYYEEYVEDMENYWPRQREAAEEHCTEFSEVL